MKTEKKKLKLYVVRKYIMAVSANDAIKKEKERPVDDVWLDEQWKENNIRDKIGF